MSLLLSASQASLERECKRKYALTYVAGMRSPSTPAQALGTEVDDTQLQPYLRDGRPFDYTRESGYIAAAGLAYLPKPKSPGLEVQKHFVLPSATGKFSWQGYLDLWLPIGDGEGPSLPTVKDFKTTKNIGQWAKGPAQLAVDPQAMLYATWAMWTTGSRLVDLEWLYFQTQGAKKVKRSFLRVDDELAYEQFLGLERTGAECVEIRAGAAGKDPQEYALSLEPTPEACDNFGGCPFRSLCNLGPADEILESKTRLPTIGGTSMTTPTVDLFARLKAKQEAPVMGMADTQVPEPAGPSVFETVGINPPEKSLPPAPPVGTVEAKEPKKRGRPSKKSSAESTGAELVQEMEANAGVLPASVSAPDYAKAANAFKAMAAICESLHEAFKGAA